MRQFATSTTVGGYEINPVEQTVMRLSDQRVIRLSKSECLIVRVLAEEPNVTVSREQLLEVCWAGKVVTHSSLTVAIKHIRTAFAEIGETNIIVTEPKKGYLIRIYSDDQASAAKTVQPQPAQNKLTYYARQYGIQVLFFISTLFAMSQYAFFVETTTIDSTSVYYDGSLLPQSVKKSISEINQDSIALAAYPLGGLCPFYQVISVKEDAIVDFTHFIEQSDCDD